MARLFLAHILAGCDLYDTALTYLYTTAKAQID